jgi:hypothetical protein
MIRRLCPLLLVIALAACGSTTYDNSLGTTAAPTTSSTLPTGSVAELLPRMVTAVQGLSKKISAFKGEQDAASLIEHLWAAMKPEIVRDHPDQVDAFEFIVRRCRQGADRHRPADADRAYRNLVELRDAILGTPTT